MQHTRATIKRAWEIISRALVVWHGVAVPFLPAAATAVVPAVALGEDAATSSLGSKAGPGAVPAAMDVAQVVTGAPGAWVCFYKGQGYTGAKWCVTSGTRVEMITREGWDNAISSIRVSPGGAIHVCKRPKLKGECTIYSRSRWHLHEFDDTISSFVVLGGGDPRAL